MYARARARARACVRACVRAFENVSVRDTMLLRNWILTCVFHSRKQMENNTNMHCVCVILSEHIDDEDDDVTDEN